MAVIDPKKLLPESTKTVSILVPKKSVSIAPTSSPALKPVETPQESGGNLLVIKKLIKIDEVLKDTLKLKKDKEKKEDQVEEKEDRKKREENLEKAKDKKKKSKNLFSIPKSPGIDWLSNWLTWTLVGFLFNNLKGLLSFLAPIWKNVIQPLGKILYNVFTGIVGAVVTFIELGDSVYKSIEGMIEGLGGEDAKNAFNDMSGALTTAMNVAIIALMLAASTGGIGGKKPGGGNKPGRGGPQTRPGQGGRPRVTQSGGGRAGGSGFRNPFRARPNVSQGGGGTRVTQAVGNRVTGRGAARVTTGAGGKVAGKLGLKAAGKALKPILSKVPFVGGLLEFFLSWALGDPIGKAAFRGVGMTLGSWIGGLLGTLIPVPFVGTAIGAFIGGMGAAELAGLMYDGIFGGKNPPKPAVEAKSAGGQVGATKKSTNRRGRSLKKRKKQTKISKVNKTETQPGKDFKSKKEIEKFYGKDEGFLGLGIFAGQDSPYDALVSSSKIAKENRAVNGVVGSLIGTGIDLTLGQKPDSRSIKQISETLATFVQASMQMEMDKTVESVKNLFTFNEGGSVPESRSISRRKLDPVVTLKSTLTRGIEAAINDTSTKVFSQLNNAMGGKKKKDEENKNNAQNNSYRDATAPASAPNFSVTGGSADFWTLVAVASLEDRDSQARADIAQSIYNRKASGAYGGGSIRDLILGKTQYQPTWDYPNGTKNGYGNPNDEWLQIVDAKTAAAATGESVEFVEQAASDITNPTLQKNAREFVQGRTDFTNYSKTDRKGEIIRSSNAPNNYFGWDWNYQGNTVAAAPDLGAMREDTAIVSRMGDGVGTGGEVKGNPVVSSHYGKLRDSKRHGGTDIAAPTGTPLTAVRNGVYLDEFFESAWGTTSVYKTDNGEFHLYAHQSKRAGKKKGDKIKAGEIIGYVGSTGRSTGPHLHWEIGTGWNGYVLSGKSDPLKKYSYKLPFTVGRKEPPSSAQTPEVSPLTSSIPTATGLGRQGTTKNVDYGAGSGAGAKGYIIVPGHAAGGGAPGEMELTPALARNIVANVKRRVGSNVPIKVLDMHGSTANTDSAFTVQQNQLKSLEQQGYEVIELHMDASLESGVGTGRGVILPMPGTDAINPVEADFARTAGAFAREHRGGLAGTNRGVSLIELGNMSPEIQQKVLRGGGLSKQELDKLTKPLEDSLIRGMGLQERASLGAPQSREVASLQRTPDYAEGQTTILYQKEVVLVG